MKEEWRDITGYEGYYQISSFGRVKSVERNILRSNGHWMYCRERIFVPFQGTTCNYLETQLSRNNIKRKFMIHRLVAYEFLELKKDSTLEVNHKDGNRHNNRLDNIELVTHKQNIAHSIENNLKNDYGELSTNAALTNQQAEDIRSAWRDGFKQIELANKYNVSKQTINSIVHYKSYFR